MKNHTTKIDFLIELVDHPLTNFEDEFLNSKNISDHSSVENCVSTPSQDNASFPSQHFPINFSLFDGNILTVFDEQYLKQSLGWTFVLVIAYFLVFVAGVIGNLMVIIVVIKRPQMRSVTNMFVLNLALADLFVILFCVPATLLSNVFTPWILGSVMCKGVPYVQGVSVCASAYSLAAISLDRCKAIYRPLERYGGLSKRQAALIIFLIWLMSLVLIIPWAIFFDVVVLKKNGNPFCIETWENKTHGDIYYLVAILFCCYILPLIVIIISNIIILCRVSRRELPQDAASASIVKKIHQRTRHGVRKSLGIVTFAFLLSWLPLHILVTRLKFTKNIGASESTWILKLLPFAQWLGSMNSSINPIMYTFLNKKFRAIFISFLPKWVPFVQNATPRFIVTYQPRIPPMAHQPCAIELP